MVDSTDQKTGGAAEPQSQRALAEFTALRQEIEYRTNAQLALISLNVTAIGTIAGFGLTNDKYQKLIVILAMLCPSLGLLWVDHAITIENIGDYIRDKLGFEWELEVLSERRKMVRRAAFVVQMFMLFGAPAFAALIIMRLDYNLSFCRCWGNRIGWGAVAGSALAVWFTGRLSWVLLEPRYGDKLKAWWRRRVARPLSRAQGGRERVPPGPGGRT